MMTSASPRRLGGTSFSRRALLGGGLATAAALGLRPLAGAAGALDRLVMLRANPAPAAGWRPWLLASPSELRPAAPSAPTAAEVDELLALQGQRTAATNQVVARWGTGPAVLPWTELALELIKRHKPGPVRAGRALALLHVAAYDAVVAALDAQAAHGRPAPASTVPGLTPLGAATRGRSSFPSEHAAVAGAAATALAYLFPDEPGWKLEDLAGEAARSRLQAGAAYRSDIAAGLALGRTVGARAVARGLVDGADAVWDGTRPTGPGTWRPTAPDFVQKPLDPLAGIWQTWVLASGSAGRPAPPPAWGSPAWEAELSAVQAAVAQRTPEQEAAVRFWAGGAGTATPGGIWIELARGLILRNGLDTAHAARVLALTSVAIADAFVCCWDAKYAYWSARPVTADPDLDVLIPTPPFPSYTSGHSTISAAAATVLGHLFPGEAADLAARAQEAAGSRLWAGLHYPIDNETGAAMGRRVGRLVAAADAGAPLLS